MAHTDTDSDDDMWPTRSISHGHAELLNSLTATGRKKARAKDSALEPYIKVARWIPRGISPFINLSMTFAVGLHDEEAEGNAFDALTPAERDGYFRDFKQILALLPNFSQTLDAFGEANDVAALMKLVAVMSDAAGGSRSDDCGGLKHAGLAYVCLDPQTDVLMPPIVKNFSKSERGLNHKMLGALLCPRSMLQDFNDDPTFVGKLLDGRIKMLADDWCTFLYEDGVYDESELDKGLLRGYFLLRVYRHIFTGPSSALKARPASCANRASNAKLHGMTRVTPRTIAYAAVQARFLLSTMDSWSTEDGHFDMKAFYYSIVQLFDDMESPWVIETLAWWDMQVFGIHCRTADLNASNVPAGGSRLARTLAQRAARSQQAAPSESQVN